jgi:predicted alpha/beta hydrolase family esterase
MESNYFLVHGSFGNPYVNWFEWLFKRIEKDKKQVYCPQFPTGVGRQNYENWSKLLKYYLDIGIINENTIFVGHSIAPIFITKFIIENKIKVKRLIFVCGFNNYLGINDDYDNVNRSMYTDNIEEIHKYCDEIICYYTDNDPYVKIEAEEDFAKKVATKVEFISGAGHINAESGFTEIKEIEKYL